MNRDGGARVRQAPDDHAAQVFGSDAVGGMDEGPQSPGMGSERRCTGVAKRRAVAPVAVEAALATLRQICLQRVGLGAAAATSGRSGRRSDGTACDEEAAAADIARPSKTGAQTCPNPWLEQLRDGRAKFRGFKSNGREIAQLPFVG